VYEMIAWRRTGDTRLYAGGCSHSGVVVVGWIFVLAIVGRRAFAECETM